MKICENEKDYEHHKQNIFNMQIKGHKVHGLLAEQMVKAEKELYLSITLQGVQKPTLIASRMGGMDIEQVSRETPDEIVKIEIDPFTRLKAYQKKYLAKRLEIVDLPDFYEFVEKVENAFFTTGATTFTAPILKAHSTMMLREKLWFVPRLLWNLNNCFFVKYCNFIKNVCFS